MLKGEALEFINGNFGANSTNYTCKNCDTTDDIECRKCVDEAFDIAIECIRKIGQIEDAINFCNNCECYHGVKEYPEIKAYEDIKEIIYD